MPTYFVNPNGSNTSPFDTRAKGASTFKGLFDNIVQADGDICEVCDGGEIDDSGIVIPNCTKKWIIRSHSENLVKPIVKMIPNGTGFGMILGATEIEVYNLIMKKYGIPSSQWITYNPTSKVKLVIKGCYFWGENIPSSPNAAGILIENPANFSNICDISGNEFYNTYYHIRENPGGS